MRILVSACLLGINCKYSGGNNLCPALAAAVRQGKHELVPVCPEVYGGLPTPRPPAERFGKSVVTQDGTDVTPAYQRGAEAALALGKLYGCEAAILQSKSPSCGCGFIYDGSFAHKNVPGDGVTAALLKANGIAVYSEQSCGELLK
jgi:uncharacterized protein YbbK (DUF523 family)